MLKEILAKVMSRQTLSRQEAYQAMRNILEGEGTPSQISSFISLLTFRGVETEELIGLTRAMRNFSKPLPIDQALSTPIVDTCGTGGAGIKTFNVSTASAIVASSSGMKIAKHGNRAVTSLTGSADVLQELGLDVDLSAEEMVQRLKRYHMCFMFAPMYHQAMKYAASTRKEIGFRSVFNLLGPLTNPAGVLHQVIGVFDSQYSLKMAETLKELGSKHVLIVASKDGLDEFSVGSETFVTELKDGNIKQYFISPEDVGLMLANSLQDVQVMTPQESAQLILDVLQGENKGTAYDMICYNAGAALYVGEKARSLRAGVQLAQQLIDSGTSLQHYFMLSSGKEVINHA